MDRAVRKGVFRRALRLAQRRTKTTTLSSFLDLTMTASREDRAGYCHLAHPPNPVFEREQPRQPRRDVRVMYFD